MRGNAVEAFLHFVFRFQIRHGSAVTFFNAVTADRIMTGEEWDVASMVRDRMHSEFHKEKSGKGVDPFRIVYLMFRGWNAFITGEKVSRFNVTDENLLPHHVFLDPQTGLPECFENPEESWEKWLVENGAKGDASAPSREPERVAASTRTSP